TVDRDDDRERAFAVRREEEHGNLLAVEAREAMQCRTSKLLRRDVREVRELRERALLQVVDVHRIRIDSRGECERDAAAVGRTDDKLDNARLGQGDLRAAEAAQAGVAVDVRE